MALTGNEVLLVTGIDGAGHPSGVQEQTTTQAIANLASAGSGTVTSVSVVTANGVSGTVATATTTPAITLTLAGLNAFTAFSGPTSTLKTFTLPNASDTISCLGQVGAYSLQQYFAAQALTDAASVAWNLNTQQAATLLMTAGVGSTRALANPTNMVAGGTYTLVITQSSTGSNALTYNTAYKFPGGTKPTLSTANNAVDILTFISDGTNMYGVAQLAFS